MRNTYIEAGDYTLEELAEDIKEGFFLKGGLSGQASTANLCLDTRGHKNKEWRIRESMRGVTISGNAFEVLKNVDASGKDFIMRVGLCGKEQINYVDMGGQA